MNSVINRSEPFISQSPFPPAIKKGQRKNPSKLGNQARYATKSPWFVDRGISITTTPAIASASWKKLCL